MSFKLGKVTVNKQLREGTHHDALEDCKFHVKYCVAALRKIKHSRIADD